MELIQYNQKKETESAMNLSSKSMICSTEIISENGWGVLVQTGQFEHEKALMSLEATNKGYLMQLPHQTISDVAAIPTASLATLKKYRGETKMIVTLCALLMKASEMLNIGKAMSDVQIKETAKLIFGEYYFLTVGDFKVCFSNGVKGKYGQLFDRLDSSIIFDWLSKYDEERAGYFEAKSRNESEQFKKVESGVPMPDGFMERIDEIAAKSKKAVWGIKESSPKRFTTLAAFLESIERNNKENQNVLLAAWANEHKEADIQFDIESWLIYKSNQLLFEVNGGRVLDWEGVISTIQKQ